MKKSEAKILQRHLEAMLRDLEAMSAEPEESSPREVVREVVREESGYYTPKTAQKFLGISKTKFYELIRKKRLSKGRYYGPRSRRWTKEELENAIVE